MRRLILIRHAKSDWNSPDLEDFHRPLAPRGRKAARWIGDTLRDEGWLPDLILCSSAARTRETLALSGMSAPTQFVRDIYDLMDEDFVDLIRTQGGAAATLALIGHNSATDTTARSLCSDRMDFGGFPTGAIVVLDFQAADWRDIAEGTGQLVAFCRPPRQ
jgi:phosphohistidine phosphatase